MSYYLELLEKKGISLTREQTATRKALAYPYKDSSKKIINKLRERMDAQVERRTRKGVPNAK